MGRFSSVSGALVSGVVGAALLAGCGVVDAVSGVSSRATTSQGATATGTPPEIAELVEVTPTPAPTKVAPTATPAVASAASRGGTVTAKRGDITGQVRLRGRVAPTNESALAFKQAGQIGSVKVKVGDKVEKGTVLVELEDLDKQNQEQLETARGKLEVGRAALATARLPLPPSASAATIADAQRRLDAARLRLARLHAGASATELRLAEIAVDQAKNSLWGAQTARDGICGQGSGPNCGAAEAAVANAQSSVIAAQARLDEVKNRKPASEDVALAELEVRSAEAQLQSASSAASYEAQVASARATERDAAIKAQETEVQHLEANVARAETRLVQLKLTAPVSGTVIALGAAAGDRVEASQSIVTLANADELGVEAAVAETDVPWVSAGQDAQIAIDGSPSQRYSAKVTQLVDTPAQGQHKYSVKLAFTGGAKAPGAVGSGVDVYVSVIKRQVMTVPKAAVTLDGDRRYVMVSSETGPRRVSVAVGLANDDLVEILSGLQEGADVLLPSPAGSRS